LGATDDAVELFGVGAQRLTEMLAREAQ
jgi:hypothetical protein